MRMIKAHVAAIALALICCLAQPAAAASDPAATVTKSSAAFKAVNANPKKGIPPALFKDIQGVAIFPGLKKVNFMVSGGAGEGVLLVRDGAGKWSSPVFVSISGGTLGWQIVGDPMDILLVFRDRQVIDALLKEKLPLVGKAAPVIGPLGANLKGASEAQLKAAIDSYVFSHGSGVEVNVATAAVLPSGAANDAFYGGKQLRLEDIAAGKAGKPSAEVAALQKLLADFSAGK